MAPRVHAFHAFHALPPHLLVPGDVRAARGVRQLDAVTVVVAP